MVFIVVLSIYTNILLASVKEIDSQSTYFSGRVSRLNQKAALLRVKVDFENAKFLTKKDKVEFWTEVIPSKRCASYVEGKSTEYILLKVPRYSECVSNVYLTTGAYLHFYSPDLERNLKAARELLDILMKKKMALTARMERYKKNLVTYPDKLEAINKRYQILRQKLELEWADELSKLEEDKAFVYKNYKNAQTRMDEVEHKIEKYKISDQNFVEDRWSLDPKLYIKK